MSAGRSHPRATIAAEGARRLSFALITAVSACAEPLPIPEDVLATAVVVSGTRAYRVDTLAERPWLVGEAPLYLLEYADEVDVLPWPAEPVEISFDTSSSVALAPMPERWRRWDGGLWQSPEDCGVQCDPWAPSRWSARGLALRPCPQLNLVETLASRGGRAARWDEVSVLQLEPGRQNRILRRGSPVRELTNVHNFSTPNAVRIGHASAFVWAPSGSRLYHIDERVFTDGMVGVFGYFASRELVDVVQPGPDKRAKKWIVTASLLGSFDIYEVAYPAEHSARKAGRVTERSRVFASDLGYVVVGPDDAITIEGGEPRNVAPVVGISVVAQVEGVGLLAAGRYTDRDEFRRAVLLRYDVASTSWRPYAALPSYTSVATMVPHEGGVLFGGKEGVGYYSRTTGACTISATLPDVTQLIAMPDGTHYVRAGNGFESTVGWLVP
jgi:hypothetical protein